MSLYRNFKNFFKLKNFLKIFGSKLFSTSLYLGYLPEWGRHWSAVLSILFSIILIYNSIGFEASYASISYILMLEFIYGFLLAIILVPLFRYIYSYDGLEVITIDSALAQILMLAMSIPAIIYINAGIINLMHQACNSFLYCTPLIFKISTLLLTLVGPYTLLRFFDILEFWPTSKILLHSQNSFFRIIAGLIPAIYSVITIYALCFLFFDLSLIEVINFYKYIFIKLYNHFIFVTLFILQFMNQKTLYIIFKKIGIIKLLDYYGLINMQHADLKYL